MKASQRKKKVAAKRAAQKVKRKVKRSPSVLPSPQAQAPVELSCHQLAMPLPAVVIDFDQVFRDALQNLSKSLSHSMFYGGQAYPFAAPGLINRGPVNISGHFLSNEEEPLTIKDAAAILRELK